MRRLELWAGVLVVPLALLLFLQWPLRDWMQAYSRQANDLGQILFALYIAVAVTAASRAGMHLAARRPPAPGRPAPWRTWALLACVAPWACHMLWAAFGMVRASVTGMERFAETSSPGYFIIKLALVLLLVLVLVQAIMAVLAKPAKGTP